MPVGVQPPPRPFAAAMARRSSRGCWVFRASLGPSCEDIIWETLVGATFVLEPRRLAAAADAAAFFDIIRGSGQAAVERAVRQLLGRDLDRLHAAMTAALGRERAVALELERRHARLAATLIQRGLFDRRLERDGASQRQVLAEAVTVCRRRLARLERATACTVAVIEPAFAVLLP
jgi:hypothetical protein